MSTLTKLSIGEIRKYLQGQKPAHKVEGIVLHHTINKTSSFAGLSSIQGIKSYHIKERGWSDIGYNAIAGPDGFIYTCRPLSASNWAHSFIDKPFSSIPKAARDRANGNKLWANQHCIGISCYGDYNSESVSHQNWPKALDAAISFMAVACDVFNIDPDTMIFRHDALAYKSGCPGTNVAMGPVIVEVKKRMGVTQHTSAKLTINKNSVSIPMVEINGSLYVALRLYTEAVGGSVEWDSKTNTANVTIKR